MDLINGAAFKPTDWSAEGLPIIRIQNLNNPKAAFNHFAGELAPKFRVQNGDLLFAWSGTPGTSFGAHIWAGGDAWLNQHIFRVEFDKSKLESGYLRLAINQNLAEYIRQAHGGAGLAHITKGRFEESEILIPPLNEQRRIVAKLDALFERSRNIRDRLDRIPTLLGKLRKSILAAAFRGDLTREWRKQHPDAESASVLLERIRAERRKRWEEDLIAKGKDPKKAKYVEPAPIDTQEMSELPEGWCWASLDQLSWLITDGEHQTPPRTSSGVPLLSARNVLNGTLSLNDIDHVSEETFSLLARRFNSEAGDVLLSCSGSVGRSCVVPANLRFAMVRSVAILKPVLGLGEFLSLSIRSPLVQAQIDDAKTQTAQSNLFQGKIKKLVVALPPLNEINEITAAVADSLARVVLLENGAATARRKNQRGEGSFLAKAFCGELVSQGPNDEPASALLERIRAERAAQPPAKRARKTTTTRTA